ncbi:MAG: hypothetical protein JXR83_12375 [Deltaproteobacteria bacterium]|nr:hypothetical protein [Deltaproteobacteria bacterium]
MPWSALLFAACPPIDPPIETPPLLADGAVCASDSQCESGRCLVRETGNLCSRGCDDSTGCQNGMLCGLVEADGAGAAVKMCLPPLAGGRAAGEVCATDDDCAAGLCHEFLCVELCGRCPAGEQCALARLERGGVETEICQWAVDRDSIDLGSLETPEAGSREIAFEVPAGVASFTVVLVDDDGLRVAATSLVAPDGTTLLDEYDAEIDLNPGFSWPGAVAVVVPASDAPGARPQAGEYRLRAGTFESATWDHLEPVAGAIEHASVVFKPIGEDGGLLDLNLHFATASGLHVADAPTSVYLTQALDRLRAYWQGQGGLRVAEVEYRELPPEHAVVETGDEARDMFARYSEPGPHGTSVNVYLVDVSFSGGVTGGIPGPPGWFNTSASGLAVDLRGSGNETGIMLAHELGHYLGLYHTTDTGSRHDPISDTPECETGTPADQCPDFGNLMFLLTPLRDDLVLTPGQVRVARGSALLYQALRPRACADTPAVLDATERGFATGDSAPAADIASGGCGGASAPEQMVLFRLLDPSATALHLRAVGRDFAPAVYVRQGECGSGAAEVACQSGDPGTEIALEVTPAAAGAYFIVVDGRDGAGGVFTLDVEVVR